MRAVKRKPAKKVSLAGLDPGALLLRRDGYLALLFWKIACAGDPLVYQAQDTNTGQMESVWENGRSVCRSGFSAGDIVEVIQPDENGDVSDRAERAILTWVCQRAGVRSMLEIPDVYETMIYRHGEELRRLVADRNPNRRKQKCSAKTGKKSSRSSRPAKT